MDTTNGTNGTNGTPKLSLREIREQRRTVRAALELKALQRSQKLLEAYSVWGEGWGTYVDFWGCYRNEDGLRILPSSTLRDRRYGASWPLFQNEQELALIRMPARVLCATNSYAIGLLNGLTSYVVNTGYTYRVVSKEKAAGPRRVPADSPDLVPDSLERLIAAAQDILDEFHEENNWPEWEQELFWRSREDGEYFLRHYCCDGKTILRTVEPEQILMPQGGDLRLWSFGVETAPGDIQRPVRYNVRHLDDDVSEDEQVEACDLVHCKVNTKRSIKRGLTDFCFSTHASLDIAERLRRAIGEGAALQASIAQIVQYDTALKTDVQQIVDDLRDASRTVPSSGREVNVEQVQPGTTRHIPRGMTYVAPPGASNMASYVEGLQACLRAAGVRWNAPEWLGSADASNNSFASSLTAESPFVISVQRAQSFYGRRFKQTHAIALRNAADAGRLEPAGMGLLDVQAEPPAIAQRDRLKEAQVDQVYYGLGVKSNQTIAQEQGLDFEQEQINRAEFAEQFGAPGGQLPLPGGLGGGGTAGTGEPPQLPNA